MPLVGSGIGAYFTALSVSPIQTYIYPFIYAAGISLAVFILSDKSLTKVETQRILVLYIVSFFVIFFWAAFEQSGSSLTFIADKQTDTHILGWNMPPSMVQIFNGLFVVILAVPFSYAVERVAKKETRANVYREASHRAGVDRAWLFPDSHAGKRPGYCRQNRGYLAGVCCISCTAAASFVCRPSGLSLVAKLAPRRFASLLMGVWFLGNAAGYALTGTLGALLPPTGDKYAEAAAHGIDLQAVLDGTVKPTAEQLSVLAQSKIVTAYPQLAGFAIHDLYDFFMMFVILCGGAAVLLYALTPLLKRMMHGVR